MTLSATDQQKKLNAEEIIHRELVRKTVLKTLLDAYGLPIRMEQLLGTFNAVGKRKQRENVPSGGKSIYNKERYRFFLLAPFNISNSCCNVMKKSPIHKYAKESKRVPMTAQMASESKLRTEKWLAYGCNGFNLKSPISNPMSFWTEQDVLLYIKQKGLPICSVYGDIIVENGDKVDAVDGQMSIFDLIDVSNMELFEKNMPVLSTTKCSRTGCTFCGFGYHHEKHPTRFDILNEFHPQLLDYVMRGGAFDPEDGLWKPDNRGLGYWFVMKWINTYGNMKMIIPDFEKYEAEYGNELTRYYLYGEELPE